MQPLPNDEIPAGVPVLSAGAHLGPRQGACLMEYASVLAGERFTDHPRCAHPVLAAACRAINDTISDAARGQLAQYVPDLVGTRRNDPRLTATLTLLCVEAADPDGATTRFDAIRRAALTRLARASGNGIARAWLRVTEPFFVTLTSHVVVDAVIATAAEQGDEGLRGLLESMLAAFRTGGLTLAELSAHRGAPTPIGELTG